MIFLAGVLDFSALNRRNHRDPRTMKTEIHPEYIICKVTCACGNKFVTRSTRNEIKVDICSACHPFYTGSQKFVDTAGRVDKFRKRYAKKAEAPAE